MQIFFEIHKDLPREGPGDAASTRKALSLLTTLPRQPHILDIGCGPGMQTLHLIDLTGGQVVAVDNHRPFLVQLSESAALEGVSDRLELVKADMAALPLAETTFDLLWAEGSAFIIGFENALRTFKAFLKRPGCLAATELAWTRPNTPPEPRRFFDEVYPAIQDIEANLAAVRRAGYRSIRHFVLPESAWWEHYYTPMEKRLRALRHAYADDPQALAVVELHEREIDMYRKYSDWYGYVFFVMQVD